MNDEFRCRGCGGTIAQHDRMLRCRCDHTRYCAEWPNCSPPCHITPKSEQDEARPSEEAQSTAKPAISGLLVTTGERR